MCHNLCKPRVFVSDVFWHFSTQSGHKWWVALKPQVDVLVEHPDVVIVDYVFVSKGCHDFLLFLRKWFVSPDCTTFVDEVQELFA